MRYLLFVFGLMVAGGLVMISRMKLGDIERDQFDDLFIKYGTMYSVRPEMLKTISMIESDLGQDYRVKAGQTSGDGKSWGIMQIAPRIGSPKEIELKGVNTTPEMLNDPETSVMLAAKLLGYLSKKYQGDEFKTVIAYNQGEKNTDKGKDYTNGYYDKYIKFKNKILA